MTITQAQAIDMLTQYRDLNLDLKCTIDGTANRLVNAQIDTLINMIQQGCYNKFRCGLNALLLVSASDNKYNTYISLYNAA